MRNLIIHFVIGSFYTAIIAYYGMSVRDAGDLIMLILFVFFALLHLLLIIILKRFKISIVEENSILGWGLGIILFIIVYSVLVKSKTNQSFEAKPALGYG